MKIKTSKLINEALDWAVAKCEELKTETWYTKAITVLFSDAPRFVPFMPSRDWSQAGPIIEREKIFLVQPYKSATLCKAYKREDDTDLPCWLEDGPTPLIAAMRCYVSSRLGDTVEVPNEFA
jgi:Protein of unknown function (DUF2591)